jgi:hypothetical protein
MNESRRLRWAGHVKCTGQKKKKKNKYRVMVKRHLKKANNFEYLCTDGKIMIKCILMKLDMGVALIWFKTGTSD